MYSPAQKLQSISSRPLAQSLTLLHLEAQESECGARGNETRSCGLGKFELMKGKDNIEVG
jgi:hypothetical protein